MPEFTSALSDPETSQGGHPNVHYTVGAAAATLEVEAEGREWMRPRLEEKLQAQAGRHGGVFPQSGRKAWHRRQEPMRLRSALGVVELVVGHALPFVCGNQFWPAVW